MSDMQTVMYIARVWAATSSKCTFKDFVLCQVPMREETYAKRDPGLVQQRQQWLGSRSRWNRTDANGSVEVIKRHRQVEYLKYFCSVINVWRVLSLTIAPRFNVTWAHVNLASVFILRTVFLECQMTSVDFFLSLLISTSCIFIFCEQPNYCQEL